MKRSLFYTGVEEAVKKMMKEVNIKPGLEVVPTCEAYGRVLAEDIRAPMSLPQRDSSHFDGYAIKFEDTMHASAVNPAFLKIIGRIYPGEKAAQKVSSGEACYITTGAFLPEGANTVIPIEAVTSVGKDTIKVNKSIQPNDHVILAGEDVKKGEIILKKAHILRAQDIGLLAVLRIKEIKVFKRAVVAIVSTGDELTDRIEEDEPAKVVNSHSLIISKLIAEAGGIPLNLGIVPDNIAKIREKIEEGLGKAEIILTIGGCSEGEKDFVPRTIDAIGKPGIIVHGTKIRPGRRSSLGVINGKPIVVLPGLVQSAIVGFHVFVLPLISLASGLPATSLLPTIKAKIAEEVSFKSFTPFQQVTFVKIKKERDTFIAKPIIGESSSLSVLCKASGFIVTPEHKSIIKRLEEVEVHLIPGLFSLATIQ